MSDFRITEHPILPIPEPDPVEFFWQGQKYIAQRGETIAAALFANGVRVFGHHQKDGSPLGIFCANGQCSQCMVIADGKPVKSCMDLIHDGMQIHPAEGLPQLPRVISTPICSPIPEIKTQVLILGGGPAGLSAANELGKHGAQVILVDDKHRLGGKLVLQTHRFFGSTSAVYAGTRGIDIATRLENDLNNYFSTVTVWINSTALAVFSDQKVGILKEGQEYVLVEPDIILVATGAREKFLAFKGNTLPGVYGAGAFQTLVNRDLIQPAEKLFIVGGGNVGLIAGYHALQAGIKVVGLVEALPECGGYKVHRDKLSRMGVPIYTSHTILSANGKDKVESVTIAAVDSAFKPISGTEKSFKCDSVLIAVGLDPVNEFYGKAVQYNMRAFVAGDAEEIAEASAAIFSGKIKGLEIARELAITSEEIPTEWYRISEILKSKPGKTYKEELLEVQDGVIPVIHCNQEIPCDPCAALCQYSLIHVDTTDIRQVPTFIGDTHSCKACERCIAGCPGLAIILVDYRKNSEFPTISIPYEFTRQTINTKDRVTVLDTDGDELGNVEVTAVQQVKKFDRTLIVQVQAHRSIAAQIAGIKIQENSVTEPLDHFVDHIEEDTIVCRCEHVTAGEIRKLIREGYRDINEIKTVTRAGMGACGAKTCNSLIHRIFREEGISDEKITDQTLRPIFVEAPLGVFAGEPHSKDTNRVQ